METTRRLSDLFADRGVQYLNYIVHINLLDSIFEKGILSRNEIRRRRIDSSANDISEQYFQTRRIGNLARHYIDGQAFVPLYIGPLTPMLHNVCIRQERLNDIVILKISLDVLDLEDACYSNKNCSCHDVEIYTDSSGLDELRWSLILNERVWEQDLRNYKGAEVLIPNHIRIDYIRKILVYNEDLLNNIHIPPDYVSRIFKSVDQREFYAN